MSRSAGLITGGEGQKVTSTSGSSLVTVQQISPNGGWAPAQITVGNLLTGGGTSFTPGSVVFAGASGDLDQDNANLNYNDATNTLHTAIFTNTGDLTTTSGNHILATAGKGLQIKEGTNARMGTVNLNLGTATVANTSVTANTRIFLTRHSAGASTAVGTLSVGTVTANTSFVINALNPTNASVQTNDVSTVHWLLIEPAA